MENDKDEVEIMVRATENEENRKAQKQKEGKGVKEEEGKAEKRGGLCIPKTMQRRILHRAHDTPAVGHIGVDRTDLCLKDWYLWQQPWCDRQCEVGGCY